LVVTIIGPGLSPAVCDTDPGGGSATGRVQVPLPLESSPEAARTAEALGELLQIARKVLESHPLNASRLAQGLLPANGILTRGSSALPRKRTSRLDGVLIGRCSTARGVARYLGLRTITTPQMTGNLDTDMNAKFDAAHHALIETDLAIVHLKGPDIAAHDHRPLEKTKYLSRVDQALSRFLDEWPDQRGKLRVVVAADHGTSSITGEHMPDPVPLLLASWPTDGNEEAEFSEISSAQGALGLLRPGELPVLLGLTAEKG
jgi:2,3-bisphosphoglycerate-independent phosphoglycerate mutase